ncbi:N-acetylglucosaminidase [Globicatella sulfidifaciens]|uniref:Mannosyl-glycoprotein endo-beta-N-acetylglucosamidase n=1 Tax=Globicatella sulfidifaciens TaxID=136093 RepID=A0A7X8C4D8_9LACT|nr:N-acetylglucosaminidase [Globicatella sulfidifaciens]NLJ18770.1 mannosyl-glycoprotein endo-beta-N-acetylglucosamidase [Globicatella sulfidifaciens]
MRKIATVLVMLLILSSVAPYGVLASDLETNNEITLEVNQENEQEIIEEKDTKEHLDETQNSTEIINDEENTDEEQIIEKKTDKQISSEEDKKEEEIVTPQGESEKVEPNEEAMSISSFSSLSIPNATPTSRLGHIRNRNVKIYSSLENNSSFEVAGAKYTNAVYYIKSQSQLNGELYYLISTSPSSTRGVVGWVQASDLSTHSHVGIDKASKTFYIKGNGKSYDTAWGGSKNLVYDLSKYKDHIFNVHLTEKVGNNTWYRGTLAGKTVWIHSSYLSSNIGNSTSRLGHIRNRNVKIYSSLGDNASFVTAGSTYTNAVYYIKSQSRVNGELYYLLSTSPSISRGVVGWAQASDLSTYSHVGVDKNAKTFYIKGSGKSYNKAWGGSKDMVYDLSHYKDHQFRVHLTEKVGNETWYRGTLNGKTVWIHSSYLVSSGGSSTSRLGHIRNRNVKIYSSLENDSSFEVAGPTYTNAVYYIKSQSRKNGELYYLISTSPSNSRGLVGWVKASDLSTHSHVGVDNTAKTLYFKGTGKAYRKAWGGSKDMVHSDMSQYAYQEFKVNLTEKVGNNTWYRGVFNGDTIWLHSSYVTTKTESTTSRLGHIRNGRVKIYPTLGQESSAFEAGSQYTNAVYYIKKQAKIDGQIFYLISTSPSSTRGVVGWTKAEDLSTNRHVTIDNTEKIFYFTGKGQAYSKAWGGRKDSVIDDMGPFANEIFHVHLTEHVGNNTWYRGSFNGNTIWLHSSYVRDSVTKYSNYPQSLSQIVDIQLSASSPPQTDKYRNLPAYVHSSLISKDGSDYVINANSVRVRSGALTNSHIYATFNKGRKVSVLGQTTGSVVSGSNLWYQIALGAWRLPTKSDLTQYVDPSLQDPFQFLVLSEPAGATASVLNRHFSSSGVLNNKGSKFIEASRKHGVNEVYLVSHAILESNNGRSALATGVEVGRNSNGSPVLVNSTNKNKLTDIKTVYNMYGIGAIDSAPLEGGAKRAYNEGWTSVDLAIVEGAQFVSDSFFRRGQDTLYKMRWNPANPGSYQYATDIGWAAKQISRMKTIYDQIDNPSMMFDIPVYR